MGLFEKKDRIKSAREFRKELRKERYLTPQERKEVESKAFRLIRQAGGMSKEEWIKKVVRPLERNTKDIIDRQETARLKKFGN